MTVAGIVLLAHSFVLHDLRFISTELTRHSCYSAQEHAAISSTIPKQTHQNAGQGLPVDICIETVVATLVICLGIVIGSEKLHPIRWPVWAGKIEREGDAGFLDGSGRVDKDYRGSPFGIFESRPGFVDIRKQRRDFTDWAKTKDGAN